MRELNTVDLFCGAGGASTGMEIALSRLNLRHTGLAINHWSVAVDTMRRNHKDIDTKQMSIDEMTTMSEKFCFNCTCCLASDFCNESFKNETCRDIVKKWLESEVEE